MSTELGTWLRQQREARGLTRPEMARQLIQAGRARGDRSMPSVDGMCHNLYRWERGADTPLERYKLCYCHVLGIPRRHFGPGQPDNRPVATQLPGVIMEPAPGSASALPPMQVFHVTPSLGDPRLLPPVGFAYRGVQESDMGDSAVRREVLMAAHEGSDHAGHAEARGIGEATLEQLRTDVVRLSREYMTGEPFPLFLEMRRVRGRMHDVLDRRMWPRDAADLYLLLGCLNDLMAVAAYDLGFPQAAEELLRAGWAYAVAIDHHPLMAKLRQQFAWTVAWQEPQRSRQYADSGLEFLSQGPNAAELYLAKARAAARLGNADAARQAIIAADVAHEREYHDDLLEIGGEFRLSWATHKQYAGSALIQIPTAVADAVSVLEQATELYMRGPGSGEVHSIHCEMFARADLATAQLRSGALDAAITVLQPVLSLPTESRTLELPHRLSGVRAELAAPIFRGSAQATELQEQIEEFGRETITTGLHGLSGGPG